MVRTVIPVSYAKLVLEYPDHPNFPAHDLLGGIGGEVRAIVKDDANTCAVRFSWTMNHAGMPIHPNRRTDPLFKAAPRIDPTTETWVKPNILHETYMIDVKSLRKYLTKQYGAGTLIYDGKDPRHFAIPFTGPAQGIIVFVWGGDPHDFGATGHVNLFRIVLAIGTPPTLTPACADRCFFIAGPMQGYLWEKSNEALALTALLAVSAVPANHGLERHVTEGDLLRGYAFGRCLGQAYEHTIFGADADASAGLYLEIGNTKPDLYQEVIKLIPKDTTKPTIHENKVMAVFRCLEFYESPELKLVAKKAKVKLERPEAGGRSIGLAAPATSNFSSPSLT